MNSVSKPLFVNNLSNPLFPYSYNKFFLCPSKNLLDLQLPLELTDT